MIERAAEGMKMAKEQAVYADCVRHQECLHLCVVFEDAATAESVWVPRESAQSGIQLPLKQKIQSIIRSEHGDAHKDSAWNQFCAC